MPSTLVELIEKTIADVRKNMVIGIANQHHDLRKSNHYCDEAYFKSHGVTYHPLQTNSKTRFFCANNTKMAHTKTNDETITEIAKLASLCHLNRVGRCNEMAALVAYKLIQQQPNIHIKLCAVSILNKKTGESHTIKHVFNLISDGTQTILCDPWLGICKKSSSPDNEFFEKIIIELKEYIAFFEQKTKQDFVCFLEALYDENPSESLTNFALQRKSRIFHGEPDEVLNAISTINQTTLVFLKEIFPRNFNQENISNRLFENNGKYFDFLFYNDIYIHFLLSEEIKKLQALIQPGQTQFETTIITDTELVSEKQKQRFLYCFEQHLKHSIDQYRCENNLSNHSKSFSSVLQELGTKISILTP